MNVDIPALPGLAVDLKLVFGVGADLN